MNTNPWLEKAERLRCTLTRLKELHDYPTLHDGLDSLERVAIAHWLRQEFPEEPIDDAQTLPLLPATAGLGSDASLPIPVHEVPSLGASGGKADPGTNLKRISRPATTYG